MSDGGDKRLESDEGSGGLSSTQLEQLETRVVDRLLAQLAPGSWEETLPTTKTEGESRAVCGSWVSGSMGDRGPWISMLTAVGESPAGASNR